MESINEQEQYDTSITPGNDTALSESKGQIDSACDTGTLTLSIRDWHGDPIPNLSFKVYVAGEEHFAGTTNNDGFSQTINSIPTRTPFEVHVKKDTTGYKMAAIGKIEAEDSIACLKSPRVRFEFSTSPHNGAPGTADNHKRKVISGHNQESANEPNISRNQTAKPKEIQNYNSKGEPKSLVMDGLRNMYNQNNNYTSPNQPINDLDKLHKLIEFSTTQASWRHPKDIPSSTIIEKMKSGTYEKAGTCDAYGYKQSKGMCTKYVKIALWWAGYSHNNGDIAPTTGPARLMGPELIKAGFREVTDELPDARWADPGDIIVYERLGKQNNTGHIDIRTYDGYISDFIETYLPENAFKTIGIYRKFSDPIPLKRIKAYLKVLRSLEAETVMIKYGDAETYKALPLAEKIGERCDSLATHPFFNRTHKSTTASGAYGINLETWDNYINGKLKNNKNGPPWVRAKTSELFSKSAQDMIAVAIMEHCPYTGYEKTNGTTALGKIRKGEIEEATRLLSVTQFASLPGNSQSRHTMGEIINRYETFIKELN